MSQAKSGLEKSDRLSIYSSKTGRTVTTYGTVTNIQKLRAIQEYKDLNDAVRFARELYQTMKDADFRQEGVLDEANMTLVYEKKKDVLMQLFKVKNAREFIETFDIDEDGFLNEDEQILIFTVLKERMQFAAEALSGAQEYAYSKELYLAVRELEKEIVSFQDELRKKTHERELRQYHDIGQEKLKDFYEDWEREFEKFERERENRLAEIDNEQEEQRYLLDEKLMRAVESMKIKPKARLKELQDQEKLVAINERFEEAANLRKELNDLEINEALRVDKLRSQNEDNQRKKLRLFQEKERAQVEVKLEETKNKLKIKMQKELDVLQKEINLHYHDIKRIQGLATKLAVKRGLNNDELRRGKNRARKTMEAIKNSRQSKKVMGLSIQSQYDSTFPDQTQKSRQSMRSMYTAPGRSEKTGSPFKNLATSGQLTRFNIKSQAEGIFSNPINVVPDYKKNSTSNTKTLKILEKKKPNKMKLPSLTALYDDDLNPVYDSQDDAVKPLSHSTRTDVNKLPLLA
eukprot:CAMPEP_0115000420 /NCGR_PEP_ID=MMETSP0216-20121206/16749_1 /TAXON_ID=223996 /ORGANISM="Protocruzia adherens, Strain Boccale" /LENGTH=516 /DNA_ID=CAMNT_0002365519 /DNA_START=252 /DNA_END=1802 /DNA_ORIENTATION=-